MLIAKANIPGGNTLRTPMPPIKFIHMKKGSIAGTILFAHSIMPFWAENMDCSGHITITMQPASANRHNIPFIFFLAKNKIPILYDIHSVRVYDI